MRKVKLLMDIRVFIGIWAHYVKIKFLIKSSSENKAKGSSFHFSIGEQAIFSVAIQRLWNISWSIAFREISSSRSYHRASQSKISSGFWFENHPGKILHDRRLFPKIWIHQIKVIFYLFVVVTRVIHFYCKAIPSLKGRTFHARWIAFLFGTLTSP